MSGGETISHLPSASGANLSDILPATQGSSGPGTGTTRGVTMSQALALVPPRPVTVAFTFPGTISANEVLNVLPGQALALASGSTPFLGIAGVNSTNPVTLDLNVIQSGTTHLLAGFVFTSSSPSPTITAPGTITNTGAADLLQVLNLGTADATLANVAISLVGSH